jgi:hypothetical protein
LTDNKRYETEGEIIVARGFPKANRVLRIARNSYVKENLPRCMIFYTEIKNWGQKNPIICVEENYLDISIYQISEEENFQPNVPPLMIIEIKRQDVEITPHKQQLIDYMKQHKCNTGLISNIEDAVLLEKSDDGNFSECKLFENNELISKIRTIQQKYTISNLDIRCFNNSVNGDIQSFVFLIKKYGNRAIHKIQFEIGKEEIVGYFFKVDEKRERISYNRCGSGYSKKQSFFEYAEFTKLLSIKY